MVIDGTKPGSARCSRSGKAQNFGQKVKGSQSLGLNGIEVWKAGNVSIENLTVCNFLGGSQSAGNGIWWNGGDGSGKVQGHGFYGGYLSATSTYLKSQNEAGEFSAAQYGIFSSNWSGGTWDRIYASNFNDSGFYIGACQQVCNQTLNHGHSQFNALGYSGTNSGGRLLIENSEFDQNEDGFSHQQPECRRARHRRTVPARPGSSRRSRALRRAGCSSTTTSTTTTTQRACGRLRRRWPGGDGTVCGRVAQRHDHGQPIRAQQRLGHASWCPIWTAVVPATAGTPGGLGPGSCLFDVWGIHVTGNQFGSNGSYGHPSNGDFQKVNFQPGHPNDCFSANTEIGGGSVRPATGRCSADAQFEVHEQSRTGFVERSELPQRGPLRQPDGGRGRCPAELPERSVPEGDQDRHASAAQAADDAQGVPGRAHQPVVPAQGLS